MTEDPKVDGADGENGSAADLFLGQKKRESGRKCCGCGCCPKTRKMKALLGISVILCVVLLGATVACVFRNPAVFQYPLHASCNITWTFGEPCNDVANKLVQQIETWKTNATCGTGQKCLYSLESVDGNTLIATHKTPVKFYIDDLKFQFYPSRQSNGCNVVGFSTSRIWYALLDFGTNYCNLHNLVEGAGLQSDRLYSELTRDEVCTQYTSSNCEKY